MPDEIQIIERSVPLPKDRWVEKVIVREIIDINALIEAQIQDYGIFDIEAWEKEEKAQRRFNVREARIVFKLLRTFPHTPFLIWKVRSLIQNTEVPWRILAYAEHIPQELYDELIQKFESYIEKNAWDIFRKMEICEAIGRQLSHISYYPHLDMLLKRLIAALPSEIAFRILCRENFNDTLEELLFQKSRGFENTMTESQRKRYQERKRFHEETRYVPWDTHLEFLSQWDIHILQFFPKDNDGYRSYAHCSSMLLWLWFSCTENGWLQLFRNETIEVICNNPEIGDDDTLDYILETLSQNIDLCIVRGHSWNFELWNILAKTDCRNFMLGGCEWSKIIRKDYPRKTDSYERRKRKFIVSNEIWNMKSNDFILQGILLELLKGEQIIDISDILSSVHWYHIIDACR